MHNFSDFNIKATSQAFKGDKIKVETILNQEIKVLSFEIRDSKIEHYKNPHCLYMQIEFKGQQRLVFTSSSVLMDMIQQVPEDRFPFKTKIIKKDEKRLEFS